MRVPVGSNLLPPWHRRSALAVGLAALAGAFGATPALAHTDPVPLEALNAADLRLASVGYRLATANPARCAAPAMLTGLILHDLGQYAARERDGVARHYRLSDGIGVLGVVPDSAADRAGLRAGDEIVGIGDTDVRVAPAALPRSASYDRLDRTAATIKAAIMRDAVQVHLRRGNETLTIGLTGVAGCGGDMVLAPSRVFNAWSDGTHVVVTTRLLAAAIDDDELAFIVAHEMSHNNLRHQERLGAAANGLFASFGHTAARIKQTEIEADTAAIGLMNAAGYRLEAAASFLARAGKGRLLDIATTHPGTGRRIGIVSAAIEVARTPVAAPVEFASVGAEGWFGRSLAAPDAFSFPIAFAALSPARVDSAADLKVGQIPTFSVVSPLATTIPCAATPGAVEPILVTPLLRGVTSDALALRVTPTALTSLSLPPSPWTPTHSAIASLLSVGPKQAAMLPSAPPPIAS